jgi:hypothetical protein
LLENIILEKSDLGTKAKNVETIINIIKNMNKNRVSDNPFVPNHLSCPLLLASPPLFFFIKKN